MNCLQVLQMSNKPVPEKQPAKWMVTIRTTCKMSGHKQRYHTHSKLIHECGQLLHLQYCKPQWHSIFYITKPDNTDYSYLLPMFVLLCATDTANTWVLQFNEAGIILHHWNRIIRVIYILVIYAWPISEEIFQIIFKMFSQIVSFLPLPPT